MELLQKIENSIDYKKSVKDQLTALVQFDKITDDELKKLTQYHKSSEVGILIEYLGYKKLKPFLNNFLGFLMDMNWPSAHGASKMLIEAKHLIIPEIQRIIKCENDLMWEYWILNSIIRFWEPNLVEKLKSDLIFQIKRADKQEGVSIIALSILKEKQMLSKQDIENYIENPSLINDLEYEGLKK